MYFFMSKNCIHIKFQTCWSFKKYWMIERDLRKLLIVSLTFYKDIWEILKYRNKSRYNGLCGLSTGLMPSNKRKVKMSLIWFVLIWVVHSHDFFKLSIAVSSLGYHGMFDVIRSFGIELRGLEDNPKGFDIKKNHNYYCYFCALFHAKWFFFLTFHKKKNIFYPYIIC